MSSDIKPGGKYVVLSYQCEICNGVSVKDMFYCEECMQHMCTSCGTLHDKFRLLANHTKTTCTAAKASKANKALPNQRSTDNDPESKPYDYAYNETTSKMNVLMSSKNSTDSNVQSGYVNVTDGYITPTSGRDWQRGIIGKRPVAKTDAAANRPVDKTNAMGKRPMYKTKAVVEDDDKLHDYDTVDEMKMEPAVTVTGDRFDVTVHDTPVAKNSSIVGDRVLVINEAGITVLHKVIQSTIMVYPLPWLRRFGARDGVFYLK